MKGNRPLAISISAVLTIFILSFTIQSYLDKSTKFLLDELNKVETLIHGEDWEEAASKILSLEQQWNIMSSKWSAFTNHHEIDNITESFKTTSEYVKNREKADSLASMSSLKHFIYHIPLMEKVSIENIF